MKFICMSVYPKNHKSEVENELTMVPLIKEYSTHGVHKMNLNMIDRLHR